MYIDSKDTTTNLVDTSTDSKVNENGNTNPSTESQDTTKDSDNFENKNTNEDEKSKETTTVVNETNEYKTNEKDRIINEKLSYSEDRFESEQLKLNILGNIENADQEGMKVAIAYLRQQYESLKTGIPTSEGNNKTRQELEHRIQQNINNLNNIEKDLNSHTYNDLSTYKARIGEFMYYLNHYEQVRQIIVLGGATSDIHATIDSKSDARHAKRYEKRDKRTQEQMNRILKDAAITSLRNDDMERYEEYLEAVVNGQVEPSSHPFYKAHQQSLNLIANTSPALYTVFVPNKPGRISYQQYCINKGIYIRESQTSTAPYTKNESFPQTVGDQVSDLLTHIIPSAEYRPEQQEARSKAGSLLAIGGAIVMGAKIIKNIFSDKEKNPNKRWKAAGWGAGLLALTHTDDIYKWVQDAFNWHPAEKTQMLAESFQTYGFSDTEALNISESYIGAPIATISALHFIPIYELTAQNIIGYGNDGFSFNYNNYEKYINTYNREADKKAQVLAAAKKLDQDKSIDAGLKAFNINNSSDLSNLCSGDRTKTLAQCECVQTGRGTCVERISSGINAELYKEGLKAKDPKSLDTIINEYNQAEGKNKDQLILKRINDGLLEIAGTDNKYTLEEMRNNPNIDLENKSIKGLTNKDGKIIEFKSYGELFDVAHLTDWIKENFKGHSALTQKPFQISELGRIEFDDTERYKVWKNDTDVIKARTIKEKSSLLDSNKQAYVDYLNQRRIEENKIDLNKYPLVSKIGIEFFNEEEAKNLEDILNKIKNDRRFSASTEGSQPFDTKYGRKFRNGEKLIFTTVNGEEITMIEDLSKFPTIKNDENKEKFINYMNDKNNGMRGSAI